MREIKFRAWDKTHAFYEYIDDLYWFEENQIHGFDDDRYIFEQFTGLRDKNGREIYEGDILETSESDDHCYEVVEYSGCAFSLISSGILLEDAGLGMSKIIGNIHENPDLVPKSDD